MGKSTTTSALIAHWRERGQRVGVLAVDPTSPFTGGALLGDRVRMQTHATDDDVFIRSMASRGQLGGMAAATPHAVRVLESTGFDVVLVETVGVGQAEVDIAATADTTVVLARARHGRRRAGGEGRTARGRRCARRQQVRQRRRRRRGARVAQHGRDRWRSGRRASWRPVVVRAIATAAGGIDELVEAIDKHRDWLESSGEGERRRVRRAAHEIRSIALAMLSARVGLRADDPRLAELAAAVVGGSIDAYAAAAQLVD